MEDGTKITKLKEKNLTVNEESTTLLLVDTLFI